MIARAGAEASAGFWTDYAAAWADGRVTAIAAHWNADAFRLYKAEEVAQPFLSWADTLDYWRANEGNHEAVRLAFSSTTALPLAEGWVAHIALMRWDIRFRVSAPAPLSGRAMGGDNHVLALTVGGRLAMWVEAPDAPISYIRRLYEDAARL